MQRDDSQHLPSAAHPEVCAFSVCPLLFGFILASISAADCSILIGPQRLLSLFRGRWSALHFDGQRSGRDCQRQRTGMCSLWLCAGRSSGPSFVLSHASSLLRSPSAFHRALFGDRSSSRVGQAYCCQWQVEIGRHLSDRHSCLSHLLWAKRKLFPRAAGATSRFDRGGHLRRGGHCCWH